jgi:hypothetical protein
VESFSFHFNLDDLKDEIGKAKEVFGDLRSDSNFNFSLGLDGAMIADILGISTEELRTRLVENQGNLYQVLDDMNKVNEYKETALELTRDALDRAVLDGRISKENADAIFGKAEEVIGNFNGEDYSIFVRPDAIENTYRKYEEARKTPTTTPFAPTAESTTTAPTTPEATTPEPTPPED